MLSLLSRLTSPTSLSSKLDCSTQAPSYGMTCFWARWRRSVLKCRRLGRATGSPKRAFALCVRTLKAFILNLSALARYLSRGRRFGLAIKTRSPRELQADQRPYEG